LFDSIAHREFYATTEDFISSPNVKNFSHELILLKGSRVFRFERITKLLEKKVHETVLEVDLDALVYNYNYFRERLNQNTKITCMVKAFGYGVGAYETAKTLQDHRCDYLAVAVADEGVALRTEGISMPIIVMNPDLKNFSTLVEYNLEPEIYSFKLLNALLTASVQYDLQCYPIHIKVDTGMCRLGFSPDEILNVCRLLKNQNRLRVSSVFSHLAGSDSPQHDQFTLQQIEKFQAAAQELENELGYKVIKHVLNSAGSERFPDYQLDMVRLGIALYGISAGNDPSVLQPVCTLKTSILQIRHVQKGTSVGYGRKSVVGRDSRIAVIPVGYADGLDRHLGCGTGEVIIQGKRYPTIGNICMDLTMVDVTGAEAQEGDEVIVFGKELTVSEIAKKLDTIPYEILTSVSSRVKRICFKE
jgi:alanine racemase